MNTKELLDAGIERMRRPEWHERAYIRRTIVRGFYGPWAYLYDRPGQMAMGESTPQQVMALTMPDEGWDEYKGELDPKDSPQLQPA